MNKKLIALGATALLTLSAPTAAFGSGHTEVTFCHKPGTPAEKTLTTDEQGWLNGHSKHGDTLGACVVTPPVEPDVPVEPEVPIETDTPDVVPEVPETPTEEEQVSTSKETVELSTESEVPSSPRIPQHIDTGL